MTSQSLTFTHKGKPITVQAEVVGSWALHLDPFVRPDDPDTGDSDTQPGWVVTFVPTLQRLLWRAGKADARKTLTRVLKAAPAIRDARTVDDITAHNEAISRALR